MISQHKIDNYILGSIAENGMVEIFNLRSYLHNPRICSFRAHQSRAKGISFSISIGYDNYFCTYTNEIISIFNLIDKNNCVKMFTLNR